MASSFTLYPSARKYCHDGTIDFDTATIKLMLVTSSYTPSTTHTIKADITNEVASGDGYTTGGTALVNPAVTYTQSPSAGKFDADDHVIAALTKVFRYGILYVEGTVNGIVNPLIGYILYDTTPADITVSGLSWTTQWASAGIITF